MQIQSVRAGVHCRVSIVALLGLLAMQCCNADTLDISTVLQDTQLYVTTPLRWDQRDWLYAGGTVAAVLVAHHYDEQVRTHYATSDNSIAGKDTHSKRDALPAVAAVVGTWAFATFIDDPAGYQEGWSMLEAGGLSAATTLVMKYAVHRERPNETSDSNSWFKQGDSFPSMHVSAAFAIGTVLAESGGDDYRWVRRALGYGIGAATAASRVKHNVHWLSDTVVGAALGIATAKFVVNRRDGSSNQSAFLLAPAPEGVALMYSVAFH
ncbi:MAG: phosphatase PAP2 family protein [Steroidobacteraceae bacterium]